MESGPTGVLASSATVNTGGIQGVLSVSSLSGKFLLCY